MSGETLVPQPRGGSAAPKGGDAHLVPTESTEALSDEGRGRVELHLSIASRLLREGQPEAAFTELSRAARDVEMTPRLAGTLVRVGLASGSRAGVAAVLTQALGATEGEVRLGVLRAMVRLLRRFGDLEGAREHLVLVLATRSSDRRARRVLNALLEREERWEELDASLEKETKLAERVRAHRRASSASLRRARLWGERLGDEARAALRYRQAAEYSELAGDGIGAFFLRLLWLRGLVQSNAPRRALDEAVRRVMEQAHQVRLVARALTYVAQLGLVVPRALRSGSAESRAPTLDAPTPSTATTTVSEYAAPSDQAPGGADASASAGAGSVRRAGASSSQLELVAVAEAVSAAKYKPEVAALLAAAVRSGPDPRAARKLEAHYIGRGAWRELARFYRDSCAAAAEAPAERLAWLVKLAEVLESELKDPAGAAQAWGEIVALSGDGDASQEHVRLLRALNDTRGVSEALDARVRRAGRPQDRLSALLERAEVAAARGELAAARADYEAALATAPEHPSALAGLAETAAALGDLEPARAFAAALDDVPRNAPGRAALFRRLGRLCQAFVRDDQLARLAWSEVLAELPSDEEASAGLLAAARALKEDSLLERLLRARLGLERTGPVARGLWLELASVLGRQRRAAEAMALLREAVELEPAHAAAWRALADCLAAASREGEAAMALERAAEATDGQERLALWQTLERFARERLGDAARAESYASRAESLLHELGDDEVTVAGPLGGPLIPPPLRPAPKATLRGRGASSPGPIAGASIERPIETREGAEEGITAEVDVEALERRLAASAAPPRRPETGQGRTATREVRAVPKAGAAASRSQQRQALFERVKSGPLEQEGYRLLAEHFEGSDDALRANLMREIAQALEGAACAPPQAPRLVLSAGDRLGLRQSVLRGEEGELLGLVGHAVCRLYPMRHGTESDGELQLGSGPGAKRAADALLAAVRAFGTRPPEVHVSVGQGLPFVVDATVSPRIIVARGVVKKVYPEAELRFFAGAALFTLSPDLLALLCIRREQLIMGLQVVGEVAAGRHASAEARLVLSGLSQRARDRVHALYPRVGPSLDLAALADSALHSANRAGLLVCGGVAPALAALRTKRAPPSELIALVRYAASERYLELRAQVVASG